MSAHQKYTKRCLELASKGVGSVSPNPLVGAVLVYQQRIIGEGYHAQYGRDHAEVNCIKSVRPDDRQFIQKAILYVSLEPCAHFGKTPPCTDLIIEMRIKTVVIACLDYSAKVNGKGIAKLLEHGVEVIQDVLKDEAYELNKRFFTFHLLKRPFIILKWAESKQGFIGSNSNTIKLSNYLTDKLVHQWRAEEDAIWVGYNTVKIDNPRLNVRHVEGKDPTRLVYDRNLDLESHYNLFDHSQKTLVFNSSVNGVKGSTHWIQVNELNYIEEILSVLVQHNILSVIIEGGAKLIQEFIDKNLWDEAYCIRTDTDLSEGIKAPHLIECNDYKQMKLAEDVVHFYKNPTLHILHA